MGSGSDRGLEEPSTNSNGIHYIDLSAKIYLLLLPPAMDN